MYISYKYIHIYIYIHDYIPIFASQNPTTFTTKHSGAFPSWDQVRREMTRMLGGTACDSLVCEASSCAQGRPKLRNMIIFLIAIQ